MLFEMGRVFVVWGSRQRTAIKLIKCLICLLKFFYFSINQNLISLLLTPLFGSFNGEMSKKLMKKLTFLCFQWALANLLSLKSMGLHLNESHSWSSSDYPKIGNSQKVLYRYRWIIPCVKASLICVFDVKFTPIAVFYLKHWVQSTQKGSDIDEEFANTISLSCYYRVI